MDEILLEIKHYLKNDPTFVDVNWPKDISENSNKGFIWVGTKDGKVGTWGCHYEFIFGKDGKLHTEVHLSETGCHTLFKNINLGNYLKFSKWNGKDGKIVLKKENIDVEAPDYIDKAINNLNLIHEKIGAQLSEIISANCDLFYDETKKETPYEKPILSERQESIVTNKHYYEISNRFVGELETEHGRIQKKLINTLGKNKKYSKVEAEKLFEGLMYHIDVLAKYKYKNCYDVFEVKSNKSAVGCVREALGQILLYKHLLEKCGNYVNNIYIIGASKIAKYEESYFDMLKKNIPNLFYCQPDDKRLFK